MSDTVSFDFNFDSIMNEIEKMGKDVKKIESRATKKAAEVVVESVKKNISRSSVDHEHMQDAVKISALKEDKETLDKFRGVHFGKLQYKAKWLNFGTSKMKGNNFLTKSVEETKDAVKEIIDAELKKELNL